jgi:hypothetical protein
MGALHSCVHYTLLNCSKNEKFFTQKFKKNRNMHFRFNNFFFRKSCRLWDTLEKYGKAGQTTDVNIMWRMRFACHMTKARKQKNTQNILILVTFPQQKW